MRRSLSPRVRPVKGVNIHPKAVDFSGSNGSVWSNMWTTWDWTGWIKKSVDLAVAQGANAIRCIGSYDAVAGGYLTQATYLTRQTQLAAYCQSSGVRYYPCAGQLTQVAGAGASTLTTQAVALANALAPYGDTVLGLDLANEASGTWLSSSRAATLTYLTATAAAIRAAGSTIPVTASMNTDQANVDSLADFAKAVDFFDFHLYDRPLPANRLMPMAIRSRRPFLVGEYGLSRTANSAAVVADQHAQVQAVTAATPRCLGAFLWAAIDNDFGLYDESTVTAQTAVTGPFATRPGA